ncbi:MAG: nucleotide exchange factor GrpE [Microcoleaceae cyanobacterium]|jgi:molecular chaperone GrpE (heat shock protein)
MPIPDYRAELETLMQNVGIANTKELSKKAKIPELQIIRIRRGLIRQTPVDILLKLSQSLQISLSELINTFAPGSITESQKTPSESAMIAREYQLLQKEIEQQRENLEQEFQQQVLETIESWLLSWPTVVYRVGENPQLEAQKILPLVKPIEKLMEKWNIEPIAPVGTIVAYNPQYHQLMEGNPIPGEPVRVRYTGYQQKDKLLYRAKVSPLS